MPYTTTTILLSPFEKWGLGGICGGVLQHLNPPHSPFFKGGSENSHLSSYKLSFNED